MAKRKRTNLGVVVDGTTYNDKALPEVIRILESARKSNKRICWRYGDPATGRDWGDRRMCGTIGRSMGPVKIPLHIASRRSYGGEGLLEANIIRIYEPNTHRVLYQHRNYYVPK